MQLVDARGGVPWGAQMRSCSSPELVEEAVEQVASADSGRLLVADEGRSGCWIRRLQPEGPVRPMGVVVLNVDLEGLLEVAAADDQQPRHSARTVRTQRSAWALALGARTGVSSTSAPSERMTSSKARVDLVSRSRSRNRMRRLCSSSASSRLRSCWGIPGIPADRLDEMLRTSGLRITTARPS